MLTALNFYQLKHSKMDLGTAIVGAVCVVVCILPFVLINYNRKKSERYILLALKNNANQHNSQISQHELHGHFAIGVDEKNKFVYFYHQNKGKVSEQFIDLSEMESCQSVNTSRTINNRDGDQKIIERLELCFTPRDKTRSVVNLEFFNANNAPQLNGELQLIENWANVISSLFKK